MVQKSVRSILGLALTLAGLLSACSVEGQPAQTNSAVLIYYALRGGDNSLAQISARGIISAIDADGNETTLPPGFDQNKWHSEMTWSPNGQWLAFSTAYENAKAGGNSEIFITRWPDQDEIFQVTSDPYSDINPAWSPDGEWMAYKNSGENYGIYVLDVRCMLLGEQCEINPTFVTIGSEPAWSPDGNRIVYNGLPKDPGKILVLELNGNDMPIQLSPEEEYCHRPQWSPGGTRVTFDCNKGLYVAEADGADLRLLAEGAEAKWSPDGELIAFIGGQALDPGLGRDVGLPGFDAPARRSTALFVIAPDGTGLKRITADNYMSVEQFFWVTPEMLTTPK